MHVDSDDKTSYLIQVSGSNKVCELMGNLPETHTIVANAPYADQQEEAIDFVMAMACVENGCKLKDINRSEVEEGMYLAFGAPRPPKGEG